MAQSWAKIESLVRAQLSDLSYFKQIWFFLQWGMAVAQLISCLAYVDYTNTHISLNPCWAALPISTHRTSVFRSLKGQKEQSPWGHLILSQAEIESSTKPGFTESMSLKGFSQLLLLCWLAIIFENHNLNNIEQMSMLKAKCDFDGGDCCPNETFSNIWDTYCDDCQCLEWTWSVENSKGQFCLTLYWFTWLKYIEVQKKSFRAFLFFYYLVYVCQCLYDFFSYFSNPANLTNNEDFLHESTVLHKHWFYATYDMRSMA